MLRRNQVPDKRILQKLNQRLERTGMGAKSQVTIAVHNGKVTLSGVLQYDSQRRPLLKALRRVEGVGSLIDQLQLRPREKYS